MSILFGIKQRFKLWPEMRARIWWSDKFCHKIGHKLSFFRLDFSFNLRGMTLNPYPHYISGKRPQPGKKNATYTWHKKTICRAATILIQSKAFTLSPPYIHTGVRGKRSSLSPWPLFSKVNLRRTTFNKIFLFITALPTFLIWVWDKNVGKIWQWKSENCFCDKRWRSLDMEYCKENICLW